MHRMLGQVFAGLAFLGVALGALGAHGLKSLVRELPDAADRLAWWETGARYHLVHALALGLVAVLAARTTSRLPQVAAGLFIAGVVLFSGSLYAMGLTGARSLGAITPIGGLAQLSGWLVLLVAVRRQGEP